MKQKQSVTILFDWIKLFLSSMLTAWMVLLNDNKGLFTWDAKMLERVLIAGLVGVLPVIIAYLNPNDKRYGIGAPNDGPGGERPPVKPGNP
jgi:hypothetical protein